MHVINMPGDPNANHKPSSHADDRPSACHYQAIGSRTLKPGSIGELFRKFGFLILADTRIGGRFSNARFLKVSGELNASWTPAELHLSLQTKIAPEIDTSTAQAKRSVCNAKRDEHLYHTLPIIM
jgi:hypothetical protein